MDASKTDVTENTSYDTIEINRSDDYSFDAEEIMYLSGVRSASYTPGTTYTLKDMNEDGISELFISANGETNVYAYDAELDMARKTNEYLRIVKNIKVMILSVYVIYMT